MDATQITQVVSSLGTLGISSFIIGWVYKLMNKRIEQLEKGNEELKKGNEELKKEIDRIKASENRWYKRYNQLVRIILDNKDCNGGVCKTYRDFHEMNENEGII